MVEQNKTTLSIDEFLETEDYTVINQHIQENLTLLKDLLRKSKLEELGIEIDKRKSVLAFGVKKEVNRKNPHFLFGRYVGFIDALNEHLSLSFKQQSFKDMINTYDISEIPHVNDIILTILKSDGIRHGKLANCVGIEKSTLSGIMDKLVDLGAVTFSRPGKYKYYYLTELGKKYYEENKKVLEAERDINSLTEQLLLVLSKEDNANEKVLGIIRKLSQREALFEGYESNSKKLIEPALIFAGIPRIEPINVRLSDTNWHTIDNAFSLLSSTDVTSVYLLDRETSNINSLNTSISVLAKNKAI